MRTVIAIHKGTGQEVVVNPDEYDKDWYVLPEDESGENGQANDSENIGTDGDSADISPHGETDDSSAPENAPSCGDDLVAGTVPEVKRRIAEADAATLDAIEEAEQEGKNRAGVADAIAERREELNDGA